MEDLPTDDDISGIAASEVEKKIISQNNVTFKIQTSQPILHFCLVEPSLGKGNLPVSHGNAMPHCILNNTMLNNPNCISKPIACQIWPYL